MFDTHSHLNFKDFNRDYPEVIAKAEKNGVSAIINVGADFATSEKAIKASQEKKICYAAIGIHPVHTQDAAALGETEIIARLEKLAENKKVVAIGETGLDYYHLPQGGNEKIKMSQKRLFQIHLKLAHKLNLPLILHCRDAYEDLLSIIKAQDSNLSGVIHCFCGSEEAAKKFLDLGFYLGFTGLITYPGNEYLAKIIATAPDDKILAETDCPYLAPQAKRGERNLPHYVKYVIEYMAKSRGVDFEEMERITSENAEKLFFSPDKGR
ncbi:MAG: TatD family hydrolase [bacterium]|nr:TatD family hydrolase [bacterium]